MILVDDFSRMMWVAFLKERSEAFEKFKIFKNRVKNEFGMKIKCLRLDRGGSNLLQMSSTYFVKKMESKDNYKLQEPLNKMVL